MFDIYFTNSNVQIHTATNKQVKAAEFVYIAFKCNDVDDDGIVNEDILHLTVLDSSLLLVSQLYKMDFSITLSNQ